MKQVVLKIPQLVIAEMWAHGLEEFPRECCGFLAGRHDQVLRCVPVRNELQSETRYKMEPKEQLKTERKLRQFGLETLVFYHSHTRTPAYPSATDVELAFDDQVRYLLISFQRIKPEPIDSRQANATAEIPPSLTLPLEGGGVGGGDLRNIISAGVNIEPFPDTQIYWIQEGKIRPARARIV